MAQFDLKNHALVGTGGLLSVRADDEITRKLAMLIEGECEGLGPLQAAKKFGFSKQRYFQLRAAFDELGADTPKSATRPKDPLPPNGRGCSTGDPAPLPRLGSIGRSHRSKTHTKRIGDQHPQRATGDRRVRPSKKNSISIAQKVN